MSSPVTRCWVSARKLDSGKTPFHIFWTCRLRSRWDRRAMRSSDAETSTEEMHNRRFQNYPLIRDGIVSSFLILTSLTSASSLKVSESLHFQRSLSYNFLLSGAGRDQPISCTRLGMEALLSVTRRYAEIDTIYSSSQRNPPKATLPASVPAKSHRAGPGRPTSCGTSMQQRSGNLSTFGGKDEDANLNIGKRFELSIKIYQLLLGVWLP